MKRIIVAVIALFMVFAFTSCKKDYTCTCTFTDGTPNLTLPIQKASKTDATDVCDASEATYKIADPGVECTI